MASKMSKIAQVVVAVVLGGASISANAWWGGPFAEWANDFFSDAGFDFNFSFSVRGSGHDWGRGYDYYGPYGYPYWGAYRPMTYGPPGPVLSDEQRKVLQDQQTQALQQAVEAQRRFAEQLAHQQPRPAVPIGGMPLAQSPSQDTGGRSSAGTGEGSDADSALYHKPLQGAGSTLTKPHPRALSSHTGGDVKSI
jgi:Sulphur globule protein